MRRGTKSVTIPSGYAEAWARLFSRSPAEIEAERASRQPAPAPQPAGSRKGAKEAPQRTQAAPAVSLAHSDREQKK